MMDDDQDIIDLAQAYALLTDTLMVLEMYKVSKPLQSRIGEFIETIPPERKKGLQILADKLLTLKQNKALNEPAARKQRAARLKNLRRNPYGR